MGSSWRVLGGLVFPARLSARVGMGTCPPGCLCGAEILIAATALVHGMVVVTRNVGDFQAMGVGILNPWVVP